MSTSKQSSWPENVLFYPDAAADLQALDKGTQTLVIKALKKIAGAPTAYGKPLENQGGRQLAGYRSTYVDRKRVRIIWHVLDTGAIALMVVAAVGQREGMEVYTTAAARRFELESWLEAYIREPKP